MSQKSKFVFRTKREEVGIMNEKEQKILEALQVIADALMWINAGGKDITEDVNNLYDKINDIKQLVHE